jgi:D-alanyl-D-alanine carboxypeptidase/D-alanyl-D-alanine-endopeptidase (penicillin-binding protein 4)
MAEIARRTNVPSDNFLAETLLKVVGAEFGGVGTTSAGAAIVRRTLRGFGLTPRVVDGSGLSPLNRTSPRHVVRLLERMDDSAAAAAFGASLPVAGRDGTLRKRMRATVARDRCRAKTGTLRGVSTLAGYCASTTGARVGFALLMNRVSIEGARRLQDRMLVALARYSP